jgi:hypothetical protein
MHGGFSRPEAMSKPAARRMAPEVGFEPTTNRLTADRSTTELLWITYSRRTIYEAIRLPVISHLILISDTDTIETCEYMKMSQQTRAHFGR